MKKSLTKNREMTIEELFSLFLYLPYSDEVKFKVMEDGSILFKGVTWLVTLDHKTGDFRFTGELTRYYDIDTILSIRDCFGDIYSIYNFNYGRIPVGTWMTVGDGVISDLYDKMDRDEKKKIIEERRKVGCERQKAYYWAHKDEILRSKKEKYDRMKKERED